MKMDSTNIEDVVIDLLCIPCSRSTECHGSVEFLAGDLNYEQMCKCLKERLKKDIATTG